MESVPSNHIQQLDVSAGADGVGKYCPLPFMTQVPMSKANNTTHAVKINAHTTAEKSTAVTVSVVDPRGHVVAQGAGMSDAEFQFKVREPRLWSPSSPTLYNLTIVMGDETVHSYTGFRTISSGLVNGVVRPLLNGEFNFMFGTLDQGFWPDGLYLPPNREAMMYDLKMLKSLGFNMLRKHVRESHLLCHRRLAWHGMAWHGSPANALRRSRSSQISSTAPATRLASWCSKTCPACPQTATGPPIPPSRPSFSASSRFSSTSTRATPPSSPGYAAPPVQTCTPSTRVLTQKQVIYNEGWGQLRVAPYPEGPLTDLVRRIDPTRLVNSVTGWNDHGFGDFSVRSALTSAAI
jgi:hypothetical protein